MTSSRRAQKPSKPKPKRQLKRVAIPEDPAHARAKRVALALGNPVFFGEQYLRPYDVNWTTALPPFAHDLLRFMLSARRGVGILAPEFLKTTLGSQLLPLWLTYRATLRGELLRGMLLSEEEGLSISNLAVVKWHILNNEYLHADFSDSEGRPLVFPSPSENVWREDAIIVHRPGASKDPTWQAKGLDSKGIQGRRIDWLIGDDVITPRNAFSPAMREHALRNWDMQITTRLVKDGKAIVLGNFNHPQDLVSTLADRPAYEVFKRPAIHAISDPSQHRDFGDDDGVPLWPENWSLERLAREREEKPSRFGRIFLLTATQEQGSHLRVDWVRLIGHDDTPFSTARYYLAIDAAPGGETHDLDYFNITVGAWRGDGLDIVECFNIRADTARQVMLVGLFHDRYDRMGAGVTAIGGANVAMDRYFTGALTMARPDLAGKCVALSLPGSKEERLMALGPYAQTGWLRIQEGIWQMRTADEEDRWQELSLYEQWREFPNARHDDALDGVEMCIRVAREFSVPNAEEFELEVVQAE